MNYLPSGSSFGKNAEAVLGYTLCERGIYLIGWGTASEAIQFRNNSFCRSTRPGDGQLYFDWDDRLLAQYSPQSYVRVFVEYNDTATDRFKIHWGRAEASTSTSSQLHSREVTKEGTANWKTEVFEIPASELQNSGPLHCDFSVDDCGDGAEFIRRIEVRLLNQASSGRILSQQVIASSHPHVFHVNLQVRKSDGMPDTTFCGILRPVSTLPGLIIGDEATTISSASEGKASAQVSFFSTLQDLSTHLGYWCAEDPAVNTASHLEWDRPPHECLRWWLDRYRIHVEAALLLLTAFACIATGRRVPVRCTLLSIGLALLVLGAFSALAMLMLVPLYSSPSTTLPGMQDPLLLVWVMMRNACAGSSNWKYFFDAAILYPHRNTLSFSEHMLVQSTIVGAFLAFGQTVVLGYNFVQLISFSVAGLTTYIYVHWLTKHRGAAMLAGCIYAFYSYRFRQVAHLQMLSTELVPLCFYYLHRMLQDCEWRFLPRLVLASAIQFMLSAYVGVYLVYFLGVFAAGLLYSQGKRVRKRDLLLLAVGCVWFIVLVAPILEAYSRRSPHVNYHRDLATVEVFALRPIQFFQAPRASWMWGWTERMFGGYTPECGVFYGLLPLSLAALQISHVLPPGLSSGMYLRGRRLALLLGRPWIGICASMIVAAVFVLLQLYGLSDRDVLAYMFLIPLAIGFWLLLGGSTIPVVFRHAFVRRDQNENVGFTFGMAGLLLLCAVFSCGPVIRLGLYEPRNWLYVFAWKYLPGIGQMRVPQRICLVGSLPLALLASLAFVRFRAKFTPRYGRCLTAVACAVVLLEYLCIPVTCVALPAEENFRFPLQQVPVPKVYRWLAEQPEIDAIAEIPDKHYVNYQLFTIYHGKRLLNGYSGYFPFENDSVIEKLLTFPEDSSIRVLRQHRVRWVVVHLDQLTVDQMTKIEDSATAPGTQVKRVYSDNTALVYEIMPSLDFHFDGPLSIR